MGQASNFHKNKNRILEKISANFEQETTALAGGIDQFLLHYVLKPPKWWQARSSTESLPPSLRKYSLSVMAQIYGKSSFISNPETFFPKAKPINPIIKEKGEIFKGATVTDLTWKSEFEPMWPSETFENELKCLGIDASGTFCQKYKNHTANEICHVRLISHGDRPRPCIVILHGYWGGYFPFEQRHWPCKLFFQAGFDIVMKVLPFHSYRKSKNRTLLPPRFPSSDPRFTVESFRQVVYDYYALLDYLEKRGLTKFALTGMSLGGYCSSLIGTLDDRPHYLIPVMPLISLTRMIRIQNRFSGTTDERETQETLPRKLFHAELLEFHARQELLTSVKLKKLCMKELSRRSIPGVVLLWWIKKEYP